jgi:molybdopterin synthase sulfur carrier subunit
MAHLIFFARVREQLGIGRMELALPPEVTTVAGVRHFLCTRSDTFRRVLEDPSVQFAVNQCHAGPAGPVSDADEIAVFPPVSGG